MPDGELVTLLVSAPFPLLVTVRAYPVAVLNVAVTFCAALIETTQAPVPVHAPLQPAKAVPVAAVAVSSTDVPDE